MKINLFKELNDDNLSTKMSILNNLFTNKEKLKMINNDKSYYKIINNKIDKAQTLKYNNQDNNATSIFNDNSPKKILIKNKKLSKNKFVKSVSFKI